MLLRNNIDLVIFDLDGTLRHSIPSADTTQYNFAVGLGVVDEPGLKNQGTRWAHSYWAQSPELKEDVGKFGNDLTSDFWANYLIRYLRALSVPEERAATLALELNQAMIDGYNPESRLYPNVPETLQTIKDTGIIVGIVSNRSKPCNEELDELGLSPYLDFAYVAAEVDAWKPDPRIFDRALKQTSTSSDRVIYVGDNYYSDIVGAQKAGLHAILIDSDGVFPDADCTVISKLGELVKILGIR